MLVTLMGMLTLVRLKLNPENASPPILRDTVWNGDAGQASKR